MKYTIDRRWIASLMLGLVAHCSFADEVTPAGVPAAIGIPADGRETETVKERYQNTKVKIERDVTMDDEGNYVNHGKWKWWTDTGQPLASGHFKLGQRHGDWVRRLEAADAPALNRSPYSEFTQPFISSAKFKDGNLDGTWAIFDSEARKVCEIPFRNGKRHGTLQRWFPNGQVMHTMDFQDGTIHGHVKTFSADGALVTDHVYDAGLRLVPETRLDKSAKDKTEFTYLRKVRLNVKTADDWWNTTFAALDQTEDEARHGKWTSWWANGQVKVQGQYEHDAQIGPHTWWYSNGQKQMEGEFDQNGKQIGRWRWWHQNGIRAIDGQYAQSKPTGVWLWWQDSGRLEKKVDMAKELGETPGIQAASNPTPAPF